MSVPEATQKKKRGLITAAAVIVVAIVIIVAFVLMRPAERTTPTGHGLGDTPFDFTLPDTNNVMWNLQSHINNGKPILLEFIYLGATYCGIFASTLDQLQSSYGTRIEIVSISIKLGGAFSDQPTIEGTAQEKARLGSTWTYLVEVSGTAVRDAYNVTGVPTCFLLGRDGRIAWEHVGVVNYSTLDDQVKAVL